MFETILLLSFFNCQNVLTVIYLLKLGTSKLYNPDKPLLSGGTTRTSSIEGYRCGSTYWGYYIINQREKVELLRRGLARIIKFPGLCTLGLLQALSTPIGTCDLYSSWEERSINQEKDKLLHTSRRCNLLSMVFSRSGAL